MLSFKSIGPSKQKLQREADSNPPPPTILICKKPGLSRVKGFDRQTWWIVNFTHFSLTDYF